MKKDGEDISMDKTYTIVLNNYRASNTSIYPAYKGCKVVKEINLDISEIILDYIQKHKLSFLEGFFMLKDIIILKKCR